MTHVIVVVAFATIAATSYGRDIGHECMHGAGGTVQDCKGFIRCCKQKCPRTTNAACSTRDGQIDRRTCECPSGSNTVYTSYPGTSGGHSSSSTHRRTDSRYGTSSRTSTGGSGSTCVRQASSCQHLKRCCQNTCGASYSYSCNVLNGRVTSDSYCTCTGGQAGGSSHGTYVDSNRRSSASNVYSGSNTGGHGGTSRTRSSSGGYGSGSGHTSGRGSECLSRSRSCDQLKSCCKNTCGSTFSYNCETLNGQVTRQSYCSCSGSGSGRGGSGYVVEQPGYSHGTSHSRRTESTSDRYSGGGSSAGQCVNEARSCNDLKTCCKNRCPYGYAYSCQTKDGRVTTRSTCSCKSSGGSGSVLSQGGHHGSHSTGGSTDRSRYGGSHSSGGSTDRGGHSGSHSSHGATERGGHYSTRRRGSTSQGNPGACVSSSRTCEDLKSCCQNQCVYGYSVKCQTSGGRVTGGSTCNCKSSSGQVIDSSRYGGETSVRTHGSHSSGSGGGTYQGSSARNIDTRGCKRSSKDCGEYRRCCDRVCGNRVGRMSCKSMNGVFSEAVCQCS